MLNNSSLLVLVLPPVLLACKHLRMWNLMHLSHWCSSYKSGPLESVPVVHPEQLSQAHLFISFSPCPPVHSPAWSSVPTDLKSKLLSQTLCAIWAYERWFLFLLWRTLSWAFRNGNAMTLSLNKLFLGTHCGPSPALVTENTLRNQTWILTMGPHLVVRDLCTRWVEFESFQERDLTCPRASR